ncbi:hypothetical protein HDU87_007198 [Geranomyces variabilis]|uniref:Uncharacterized protein n=1 Tax=Geranomyces variabilis TaxID=109894 RepID=A0AAD5XJU1_9FUNG|nr:hypothetical protein HDU87_007198 [Geranomyces variabilis]
MASPPPPNPTASGSPPPSAAQQPESASPSPSTGPERQVPPLPSSTATTAPISEDGGWTAPTPNLIYNIQTRIEISSDPFARVAGMTWDFEEQYFVHTTPNEEDYNEDEDDDAQWEAVHDDNEEEVEEDQEFRVSCEETPAVTDHVRGSDVNQTVLEEDDHDDEDWEDMHSNSGQELEKEKECHVGFKEDLPLRSRIRELDVNDELEGEDENDDGNAFSGSFPADANHLMSDDDDDYT